MNCRASHFSFGRLLAVRFTERLAPILAVGLFLLALLISGCATTQGPSRNDPILPEIDVIQVKQNSDEALKLSNENKLDLEMVSSKLTEMENRLLLMSEELANLSAAKLEEMENRLAILTEEFRIMEKEVMRLKASPTEGIGKKNAISTFTPNPKPDRSAPAPDQTESDLYKKASDLYYARQYDKAVAAFEEVMARYPSGSYSDNCSYWIGECHFALGNFAKAIAAFQKVFTYTNSEKGDDAQLKLGYSYLRLGDRKQAAEEFQKVLSLYPDSEYVGRARAELSKLR